MMNVRIATKEDTQALCEFVTEWIIYQLTCTGFTFDEETFKKHLGQMIDTQNAMVIEVAGKIVGGIGGRVVGSFYSKDVIFDVMTMYIDPDYRKYTGEVFLLLEKILELTAVTKLIVSNPFFVDHTKRNRYYKMKGYKSLTTSFIKDIERAGVKQCQPA